jgi:hypothetical protein
MKEHQINGVDIIFMLKSLMMFGLVDSILEPKHVVESAYFSSITHSSFMTYFEDQSQFIHNCLLVQTHEMIMSPLLEFEVLRFTHEVLQIVPKSFESKCHSDNLSTSFKFNKSWYTFTNVWNDIEMSYKSEPLKFKVAISVNDTGLFFASQ